MSFLTPVIIIFAVLGGIDYVCGSRIGLGKEFQKAFMLLGVMALSMIGMIVIAPALGEALSPTFDAVYGIFGMDPSILPASLFANDMGGAPLAKESMRNESVGLFNALVVSSMMGCTVSFTIPFALGVVPKESHKPLLMGLLCGIVTIPVGCFVAGLICGVSWLSLLWNLLPLILFSDIIAVGLLTLPDLCVKIFKVLGFFITALIIAGLLLGIAEFLTKQKILPAAASIEEGALVCLNASVVLCGMFPLIFALSKLLSRPLSALGKVIGINETAALCLLSTLATSATAFGMMDRMDRKGAMMNAAFAVSGAFVLGSHLAFTMAFDPRYLLPVTVGKLVAGVLSVALVFPVYRIALAKEKTRSE